MSANSQGRRDTIQAERYEIDCDCGTYPDNLGPCATFHRGCFNRCVYCDHKIECHQIVLREFVL